MKRSSGLLAGLTAASLTLTALGGAAWAAEGDRLPLTVNGEATGITVEEQNGGYLVPVRRLAEYLGYTVEWHPEDGTVTLDSGPMHATLTLGVNSYQAVTSLEGMVGMTAPFALAAAPYAVDGVTYAPLELFVVLMGNPEEAVTAADGGVELTTQQPADGVQLPNPWQACASLAELEQAAGYPVPLPALPEGYTPALYQAIPGSLAEVRFTGGGDTLLYRVGPGGGDVSGDYNAYPDTWSVEAGGVSVTCKGADGTVSLALWERDGYSFSLSSEHGLSTVAVEAAAAGAQQKDGPAWQARPFLVRVGAGLPDFGLEALQVLKALRPLAGVPQQGGGVVHGHHPHPGLFDPLAMLTGDFEVLLDELHGGDASQADDDLRFEQGHLVAQIADTGLLLNVQGVPVLGRAALDHVADEHLLPLQVDHGQHIVQQLARPAHKGPAGAVLLLAGALPDEHDLRVPGSLAEHHVGPGLRQAALLTVDALLIEGVPILHSLSPQCVVFDIVPHPRPRCKKILCLTFAFKLRILRSTKAERTTAPREGRQRIRVTD